MHSESKFSPYLKQTIYLCYKGRSVGREPCHRRFCGFDASLFVSVFDVCFIRDLFSSYFSLKYQLLANSKDIGVGFCSSVPKT